MSLDNETALAVIKHAENELIVKQQEITLQEKREETRRFEIEQNTAVALAQINAQAEDLKDNRIKYNSMITRRYWFIGGVIFLVIVFALSGLYLKEGSMVMDMIKTMLTFAAGGFGGYHYGKTKRDN